jgi:PmbA protein
MISRLLERSRRRADQADLALKTDETLSLAFDASGLAAAQVDRSHGVNLRVVLDGRAGSAGSTGDDPDSLLDAAIGSARLGEVSGIVLPPAAQPSPVTTHYPAAAAATLEDLSRIGQLVRQRLAEHAGSLALTVERSVGSVRVANTRGLDASYDVSQVTVAVELALRGPRGGVRLTDQWSGGDLPDHVALEQLIAGLQERSRRATPAPPPVPQGRMPVCFDGDALLALLLPLEQALLGKATMYGLSPLASRRGERVFAEGFSLTDSPLEAGRPGSRPIDDEGTASRVTPLVRQGTVEAFIYDLESAARAGQPPTGHGRRATFGKPQAAFSNLMLEPGSLDRETLLRELGDGLLVERLHGAGQGAVAGGAFSLPVALGWRVEGGEIRGLVQDVTVAGNAYDLLNRVRGVGRDARWRGSRWLAPVLIDGVAVLGRSG